MRVNITFGLAYDAGRYRRAIEGAALSKDLASFPKGNETVVGDSGVQLSGGQRARVALAVSTLDITSHDD